MEFYESLIKVSVLITCLTVCSGFVLVESDDKENGKIVENRIIYLLDLLQKLKHITESDYDEVTSYDDVTSYNDVGDSYNNVKENSVTKHGAVQTRGQKQSTDDALARAVEISKKDFAILPPANEWCRMMGFRRCRQSHS